jgi:hypothetical protein
MLVSVLTLKARDKDATALRRNDAKIIITVT